MRDGVALTPPSEAGLLEGVTRAFMFEVGREVGSAGRKRRRSTPRTSTTAQEAFITGSTRELTPVVRVDDRAIGTGRPGPVTLKLLEGSRKKAWQLSSQRARQRASSVCMLAGPHPRSLSLGGSRLARAAGAAPSS